jgi:hypothetical protein
LKLERKREAYHEAGHAAAALAFGIPIVAVSIGDRPHLHRGTYRPRNVLELERLVTLCLAGPEAERAFFGSAGYCGDGTDQRMACSFLARGFAPAEIEAQLAHCRDMAARLVRSRWGCWHIKRLASALLACGTLDGERIDIVVGRSRRGFKSA